MSEDIKQRRQNTFADRRGRARLATEVFLSSERTLAENLAIMFNRDQFPSRRAMALVSLIADATHSKGLLVKVLGRTYDFSKIPIDPSLYELSDTKQRIGRGYWSEVFLMKTLKDDMPNLVYKAEYPETEVPVEELVRVANMYKRSYERLRDAYAEKLPKLVAETHYFIAQSPRSKKPAITTVQAYAGKGGFDPLEEANHATFKEILAREPGLKREFEAFKAITLQLADEGAAPDLAGVDNLLVVEEEGRHVLRLVDPHGFSDEAEHAVRRLGIKLGHLRSL